MAVAKRVAGPMLVALPDLLEPLDLLSQRCNGSLQLGATASLASELALKSLYPRL